MNATQLAQDAVVKVEVDANVYTQEDTSVISVKIEDENADDGMIDIGHEEIHYPADAEYPQDFEDSEDDADYDSDSNDSAEFEEDDCKECSSPDGNENNNATTPLTSLQYDVKPVTVSFFKACPSQKSYGIMVNGIRYTPNGMSRWLCPASRRSKCRARIALTDDKRIVFMHEHNHTVQPSTQSIEVAFEESYTFLPFACWWGKRGKAAQMCGAVEGAVMEQCLAEGALVTVSFIKSLSKKGSEGILVNEQRYTLMHTCRLWTRWKCTGRARHKCKARVILTEDGRIVCASRHNHARTNRFRTRVDCERTYSVLSQKAWRNVVKTTILNARRGRASPLVKVRKHPLRAHGIVVEGFRYSSDRTSRRWSRLYCTSRASRKCTAKVILTAADAVDARIVFVGEHNHARTKRWHAPVDAQRTFSVLSYDAWRACADDDGVDDDDGDHGSAMCNSAGGNVTVSFINMRKS